MSVLGWDYRGYGLSGGKPGEPATLRDARTVVAYATGTLGVPPERDHSLWQVAGQRARGGGGGEPAGRRADSQSAFTSAFRVMTRVRILPFDKFIVLEKLPRVTCPVLVIHGTADEMIPFSHAQKLYAAAPGPKYRLWVEGAGHNDLVETAGDAYWQALREFTARL